MFEREVIRERHAEGIALAKEAEYYRGGQRKLDTNQYAQVCERAAAGEAEAGLARKSATSLRTVLPDGATKE